MRKKGLSLILSAVVTASVLFTGCSKPATNKGSSAEGKAAQTLIYARGADSRGLDPAYVDDGESAKVMANIFEGLVKYKDNSTELEPCLATKWTISPDGKEYTFELRKNVKFHDGTPFNADAVKFSIERQLPPNVKEAMPYASFTFDPEIVDKVEKVEDSIVKIVLKKTYTPFLANLAMAVSAPIVSPEGVKKYGEKFMENPIGTGPFKFVDWKKEQSITLERNNEYWGDKAKANKIVFKVTKENSVRASELMTGAVDIIDGVDPNDVKKLEESKQVIYKDKGMNINYMGFNCSREPFNDPKLRQAISYAIDKKELVKYLYQGYAEVANTPLPSFIPGYTDKVEGYEYNVEKAKQLLKEAGKENLKVKMITYSNPRPYNPVNGQKLAEAVQNYLGKVGVTVTIEASPWKEYKEKMNQGEGDLLFSGWIGDNGDADNFLSLLDSKEVKSGLNVAKYGNKAVDQLLARGRALPIGEERNKLYGEAQGLIAKDAPWLPISYATDMAAHSSKIKNFRLHPTGIVNLKTVEKSQ